MREMKGVLGTQLRAAKSWVLRMLRCRKTGSRNSGIALGFYRTSSEFVKSQGNVYNLEHGLWRPTTECRIRRKCQNALGY